VAIGRPELGTLVAGGIGDAAILEPRQGRWRFTDVLGETRVGTRRLALSGMVVDGAWFETAPEAPAELMED
jgi:predicted amidohydrolase